MLSCTFSLSPSCKGCLCLTTNIALLTFNASYQVYCSVAVIISLTLWYGINASLCKLITLFVTVIVLYYFAWWIGCLMVIKINSVLWVNLHLFVKSYVTKDSKAISNWTNFGAVYPLVGSIRSTIFGNGFVCAVHRSRTVHVWK